LQCQSEKNATSCPPTFLTDDAADGQIDDTGRRGRPRRRCINDAKDCTGTQQSRMFAGSERQKRHT